MLFNINRHLEWHKLEQIKMKTTFNYLMMLLIVMSMGVFAGCSDDKDEPELDAASAVMGIYTGKLRVDNAVIEDAYVVTVTKITSSVVRVSAAFYSDGGANYNVKIEGSQYIFSSESSSGININVLGKSMTLTFLNNGGTMTTFTGIKD